MSTDEPRNPSHDNNAAQEPSDATDPTPPRKVIRIEDLREAAAERGDSVVELNAALTGMTDRLRAQWETHAAAITKVVSPRIDELTKNILATVNETTINPELIESFRQAVALSLPPIQFDVTPLLPKFDPAWLERLVTKFRPRNLRGGEFDFEHMLNVMKEDGIPFCLVPDEDTAQLILDAPDKPARRRVLLDRSGHIFSACNDIIDLCVNTDLASQGVLIRRAIAAHTDAHTEAAQALATVVLDHLVARAVLDLYNAGITPSPEKANELKSGKVGNQFIDDHLNHQPAFFLQPLPIVHTKTDHISDADAFNRHATVHKPSGTQLTPANSVQAIMLATSLLGYHQNLW